ncbi:hypothetical protein CERZMDRAFT_46602 [Cercospora zeae-maydis SCOH1-5]|uniref:AMP-dependent synthetase/ligase domain-containing protein n=1 Tax=Cercospora zeae-maydis SCOH1-5 TaxID=717836 RepID=A0A6A6F7A0_9PEZI|nr:hypothetical protein CERZMDRAFT_46602 [Cercospora zeae-maydis SCOH1-5]
MPWKSRWTVDIPVCSLPTYLFKSPTAKLDDKPLMIEGAQPKNYITHHTYREWCMRFAAGLQKAGLQPGDRLMLFSGNTIFFTSVLFGTVMAGGIFTGANPTYVAREAAHQLRDSGAKFFLVGSANLATGIEAAKECNFPLSNLYVFDDGIQSFPSSSSSSSTTTTPNIPDTPQGIKSWTKLLAPQSEAANFRWEEFTSRAQQQDRTAVLNYSSGTTGLPKGVEITHYNYIANTVQTNYVASLKTDYESWRSRAAFVAFLPMYHAYGQTVYGMNLVLQGIPMYLMRKYDFVDMLEYIQKYKITNVSAVPPIVVQLAKRDEVTKYDLSTLESVGCGAAPLGKEIIGEFGRRFGVDVAVRQGWGMTEVTCTAVSWDPNLQDESRLDLSAVGELIPNIEARIVSDAGHDVPRGSRGELWVRGPNVMKGYWKRPAETLATFTPEPPESRWLMTGDIAYVDHFGLLHVVDRKKELIKVNGLQVAPAELEALLLDHPAVEDAAVVGVTIRGGECPRAYVVLKNIKGKEVAGQVTTTTTTKDVAEWLAGKVSAHKRLTGGVVAVDAIPKNPSGKLLRNELRERAREEVGDKEGQSSKL